MTRYTLAVSLVVVSMAFVATSVGAQPAAQPYPSSPVIDRVEFDFATHRRSAEGSDNWPTTWVSAVSNQLSSESEETD